MSVVALAVAALLAAAAAHASAHAHTHSHAPKLDPEFVRVTCGSAIKLTHVSTGFKVSAAKEDDRAGSCACQKEGI